MNMKQDFQVIFGCGYNLHIYIYLVNTCVYKFNFIHLMMYNVHCTLVEDI